MDKPAFPHQKPFVPPDSRAAELHLPVSTPFCGTIFHERQNVVPFLSQLLANWPKRFGPAFLPFLSTLNLLRQISRQFWSPAAPANPKTNKTPEFSGPAPQPQTLP